jgi:hypothetical protein
LFQDAVMRDDLANHRGGGPELLWNET